MGETRDLPATAALLQTVSLIQIVFEGLMACGPSFWPVCGSGGRRYQDGCVYGGSFFFDELQRSTTKAVHVVLGVGGPGMK